MDAAEPAKSAKGQIASPEDLHPGWERPGGVADGEELAGPGGVAESGREVHRPPDVVIAFEQQRVTMRDPSAQHERLAVVAGDELGRGGDRGTDLHTHEHCAVTEPLRDPNASPRRDRACQAMKGGQGIDRRVLAVRRHEGREPTQVNE